MPLRPALARLEAEIHRLEAELADIERWGKQAPDARKPELRDRWRRTKAQLLEGRKRFGEEAERKPRPGRIG